LCDYFKEQEIPHYFLDSDELRDLFDRDLGYEYADRVANLKRVITAAYVLERCGITVVVCNVSHLEHIRQLARHKLSEYHEVFLRKDISTAIRDDVKGVYKDSLGKTSVIGVDMEFEQPGTPDLVLDTDELTEDETFSRLIAYYEGKKTNGN
jgi:adenylylsulfate kinase-like enzyme